MNGPTAEPGTSMLLSGFLAFLAFTFLALALWFLMRNMNARMRRMSYRQQQAHRGRDEAQAAPGDDPDDASVTGAGATEGTDGATGTAAAGASAGEPEQGTTDPGTGGSPGAEDDGPTTTRSAQTPEDGNPHR